MCHLDASSSWNSKLLSCVSDIVVQSQPPTDNNNKDQQQCRFSASATNAIDIYKRLCIIYFCDERETTQVASITFSNDGVRLVNLGASAGEDALPSSVFLSRSMFVLYNVYPAEGDQDVQILVNFSTLMDFLECALGNVTQEDLVHPMHIVLDNWVYVSLQRAPTICDLDKAMSTSLTAAVQRFCLIPTECFGGSLEDNHTVPTGEPVSEHDEMMDNTILMLHPLNPKLVDPACLMPIASSTPALAKVPKHSAPRSTSPRPHRVPQSPLTPTAPSTPTSAPSTPSTPASRKHAAVQDNDADGPRKRLKTTSEQINMLEEWFQRDSLPTRKVREEMVLKLEGSVSLRQIEVWFQNRRAKQKKAEARRGRAGEVPSSTPPPSPSPPGTPPPVSLGSMAPNPGALIPATSPAITPRKRSHKKKINSQGTSIASTPSPRTPSPVPSSPIAPSASPLPQ